MMPSEPFVSTAPPPKLGAACVGCETLVWDADIEWMEDATGNKYPMCAACAKQPWPMIPTTAPWPYTSPQE